MLPHCAESTPRPLREQPTLRSPQAVNGSLAVHSAVLGNHTPSAGSVNITKARPGQHLRRWELQDATRWHRMFLDFTR